MLTVTIVTLETVAIVLAVVAVVAQHCDSGNIGNSGKWWQWWPPSWCSFSGILLKMCQTERKAVRQAKVLIAIKRRSESQLFRGWKLAGRRMLQVSLVRARRSTFFIRTNKPICTFLYVLLVVLLDSGLVYLSSDVSQKLLALFSTSKETGKIFNETRFELYTDILLGLLHLMVWSILNSSHLQFLVLY